jgi:hypothetical protein
MAFRGTYEAGSTLSDPKFCILMAFGKLTNLQKGKTFLFMKNVNNIATGRNIFVLLP